MKSTSDSTSAPRIQVGRSKNHSSLYQAYKRILVDLTRDVWSQIDDFLNGQCHQFILGLHPVVEFMTCMYSRFRKANAPAAALGVASSVSNSALATRHKKLHEAGTVLNC